ncbi:Predicted CoA-binding protein [Mariniphaga anaerophila]|uniref:Predicted CoA-binding protein n=1 Tax=Mariniphaga anaerophila TaxID=1484053 RepID=A0A1M4XRN7_9BACT|nr:CoA-binding protein [Mariniphaga anaerophila]SHE95953.1 Predicted CoA-binding protein [Mariniphaga anaerophila]
MTTKTEITLNEIQQFFSEQKIAVAGASRNPKKFGGMVIKDFKEKGFDMFPVNPNAEEVQGLKSYKTVADLPGDVKHLLVVTPKEKTQEIINQAVQKGMKMVWVQQMSDTPEALAALKKSGIPFIYKKCIYMFAEPVKGVHHFHRFLVKFFGGYPKKKSN